VSTSINYSANVTYHFRMVVNVTAHTYSVFVTPAGGSELTVGSNYAFRSTANTHDQPERLEHRSERHALRLLAHREQPCSVTPRISARRYPAAGAFREFKI